MQFSIRTGSPAAVDCTILPIFQQSKLDDATAKFDKTLRGRIAKAKRSGDAGVKPGDVVLLRDVNCKGSKHLLLVGCGQKSKFSPRVLTKVLTIAAGELSKTSIHSVASFLVAHGTDAHVNARTTVVAMRDAGYRFDELKSRTEGRSRRLTRISIVLPDSADAAAGRAGIREGSAIANGVDLARDLGNRPPNVCTPSHLAEAAKSIATGRSSMKLKVLNESAMEKLGMGALLSVTRGATEPARFIILEHRGGGKMPPVVLCGKGITFDTGGISLKPPPKMDEMKFDMCGAAAVLGTMLSIAELELPINVVALVPSCENMPGGSATRPGDIVTSLSGQTVEILNTDAEGRLILCDAISYAHEFEPRAIIDVATLTGACVIALGPLYTGVFSNDQELATDLVGAGQRALDSAWHMPADEEYGESLRSNFADFANAGAREGGASIAAQFLSRFVRGVPWAHLDIAGVAWKQNIAKGATGRPVALLVDYLIDSSSSKTA